MSAIPGAVEEHELHARLDGRLSPERAAEIDAYLATQPEVRARLQRYVEQQRLLRMAFAEDTATPIPARLRVGRLLAEQRRRRYQRFARIAAAVALVVVGGIGGWAARDVATPLLPSTSPSFRTPARSPPMRSRRIKSSQSRFAILSRSMLPRRRISCSGCPSASGSRLSCPI